ncbi:MAG TPA: aminotransferase class I/II-fold pyridoxal phosphate-dependent enzyme [Acidimicrobiia bacterium]|nr:aminotransferase class I/II-fold pyridoxal phosphate-dependent enzyme [Acidimicrobiia bacterium]
MSDESRSIVRRSTTPPSVSVPLVTPLQPSVAYTTDDADALDAVYGGAGFTYAREGHPNASVLAEKLGWMEGADPAWGRGVVTGSGMAALGTVLLGLLAAGDHVVGSNQLYGRSTRLLSVDLPRMGVDSTLADPTDASSIAAAIRSDTKMIVVETVSNPTLRVADVAGIAALARERGVLLVVDNTFTTPRSFRPFEHGADVVVHSVTKMLAGHSDVTLGFVIANTAEANAALGEVAVTWGFTPSPFDCWLAERGLHTFELRYDRAVSTAARLADSLAELPGVEAVLYPGRADHPEHARAASLFAAGGAMVGVVLEGGGRQRVNAVIRAASPVAFAPTLGDVATLIAHPASSSHRALSESERVALGIPEGLVRISVGIEDPDTLISELTHAFGS